MPLTELNHYLLVAKNLERTKKFYQDVLGMQLAERPDFGFPGYWLKLGEDICVHLASQAPNKIRDQFLLKKHPKGTTGSGSVDHIAFLAKDPNEVRERIQKHRIPMHFRSFPDAKLFQIFLKDPDDVTIELNFLGEVIEETEWKGKARPRPIVRRGSAPRYGSRIRRALTPLLFDRIRFAKSRRGTVSSSRRCASTRPRTATSPTGISCTSANSRRAARVSCSWKRRRWRNAAASLMATRESGRTLTSKD